MAHTNRSIDQERAAYAWECVARGVDDKYVNLAKAAPALIMQNGLMQTLAFYRAKGKDEHTRLLRHLSDWLNKQGVANGSEFDTLMAALYEASSDLYMRATEEALEILRWIRQFADARKRAQP